MRSMCERGQRIAELRHALYGKKSEQLDPDARQLAFEDLETAVAEAEAAVDASVVRNADGTTRRPPAKRNLGHLPDHPLPGNRMLAFDERGLPGNRMLAFDERGPRIEEVIEPEHKVCPCGCTDRVKIGEGEPLRRHSLPGRCLLANTERGFEPNGERRAAGHHSGPFPGHPLPGSACLHAREG